MALQQEPLTLTEIDRQIQDMDTMPPKDKIQYAKGEISISISIFFQEIHDPSPINIFPFPLVLTLFMNVYSLSCSHHYCSVHS
ncbi:MAG: hypothetical protein ACTSU4_12750 [Promethearchaeota archaeon]